MAKKNYDKELEKIIEFHQKRNEIPTLFMHSCCAPCSSYCLSYLAQYFYITVFYYNPNISPESEYIKRIEEQKRLVKELKTKYPIKIVEGRYEPEVFFEMSKGLELEGEGGERCFKCYEMRLKEACMKGISGGYEYFTTTLSVSPHKNADVLNKIGLRLQNEYGIKYLVSDFKKKGGYLKSIELSKKYDLYRQNFCGCIYSKRKREEETALKNRRKE